MLIRRLLAVILIAVLPALAFVEAKASGGEGGAADKAPDRGFAYIPLTPGLIVSFGTEGRVGYLKVDVSLRVATPAAAAIELHMPAIRHELIMLLSRQPPEVLTAQDKREALRLEALEHLRKFLEEAGKVKPEEIQDLLFTSFFTQR
jgi:flagellar FliL protein